MKRRYSLGNFGDDPTDTESPTYDSTLDPNSPDYIDPNAGSAGYVDLSTSSSSSGSNTTTSGQTCVDCDGNDYPVDASGNCNAPIFQNLPPLTGCAATDPSQSGGAVPASTGPSWWETAGTTLLNAAAKVAPGLISSAKASTGGGGGGSGTTVSVSTGGPASGNVLTRSLIPGVPSSPLLLLGVGAGVVGLVILMRRK